MKLYLAGPMRGLPHFNFPAFDAAAVELRRLGHQVFNPAEHDRTTYGDSFADNAVDGRDDTVIESHGFNLRDALGADLAFITREADGVAVLPGWETSKGATAEVSTALALGLPVALARNYRDAALYGDVDGALKSGSPHPGDRITYLPGQAPAVTGEARTPDMPSVQALANGERMSVSSTGGAKGVKPARFDLLPPYPLQVLAEHYGKGAAKYEAHNWRRGYAWSNSFAAMQRHAWEFWQGEDHDADGYDNLAAVAFHAFALMQFARDFPDFDDRFAVEVTG